MKNTNFSSHVCCFYDFVSGSDLKCSSFVLFGPVSRSRSSSVSFLATWVASAGVCFNPLPGLPRCFFHPGLGSFPILLLCRSNSCHRFWRVCSSLHLVAFRVLRRISLLRVCSSVLVLSAVLLVLSAVLSCCEPQATPVSSS
jgi:hypothetical protein